MISKSYKKIITKEEYQQLLNYQAIHKYFMDCLESLEFKALNITEEIEDDLDAGLFLGGITSDMLNNFGKNSLDDGLKRLNIEVEKDKIMENRKEMGKVTKKKKKFKSGDGWKNKELDKFVEVVDRPEFHSYLDDFKIPVISNNNIPDNVLFVGDITKPLQMSNFSKILIDEKDGLFVSETWNHDNDELGDVVG